MSNLIRYRTDVDGLRAVAVIPVVLFHAGYDWVSGGFIGVDVFFVISGFLISSIIAREIDAGTFTFRRFYERRVRRIVPALIVVLVATLAGGWFLLLPDEFAGLGRAAAAALLFVPNIHYWSEASSYFGLDIVNLPLLHTWSLGVEEQFYIFFPLLLVALHRLRRPSVVAPLLLLMLVASLLANLWLVQLDSRFSFYMIPTRAWELLAGAVVGLGLLPAIRRIWLANLAAFAGLLLILVPMVVLTEESLFPGLNAVYPVLGAVLLIHANSAVKTLTARLLGLRVVVFIGLISYSLYLWHWPITVYTRMLWDSPLSGPFIVALSVGCATLSYYLVEQRYRRRGAARQPRGRVSELAGAAAALLVVAVSLPLAGGLPGRLPEAVRVVIDNPDNRVAAGDCSSFFESAGDRPVNLCHVGASGRAPQFLVWGDSHADAISHALQLAADQLGMAGVTIWSGGCRPLLGVFRRGEQRCRIFNDEVRRYLDANPSIAQVYLVGYWRLPVRGEGYDNSNFFIIDAHSEAASREENPRVFKRGLQRTLDAAAGRQVFLVQDVPEIGARFGKSVVSHLARETWTGQKTLAGRVFDDRLDDFEQQFRQLLGAIPNPPVYVDIKQTLCEAGRCPLLSDGRSLYADGDHLSRYGASLLAPLFVSHLSRGRLDSTDRTTAKILTPG